MKTIKSLSEREKKVLYGLVRCPDEPDAQTAKEMGVPQPTFSNIQRRLKKQGYYQAIGIPDLEALGCEIITTVYGTYSPLSSIEQRKALEQKLRYQFPEIFYMLNGVHKVMLLLTGEDFVNINTALDDIVTQYQNNHILENTGLNRVNFSLPSTYISRFFDYSQVLYHRFDLEDEVELSPKVLEPRTPSEKSFSISDINQSEAKVLLFMIKSPSSSEVEMAMRLKLSRTTVSKAKNKIFELALFKRHVIPNTNLLGLDLNVFSHSRFTPGTTFKDRIGSTEWLLRTLPIALSIITNNDAITLYAMKDYHELQELKRTALAEYKSKGYLDADPEVIVYSSAEVADVGPPDFYPITKKILHL